jgi:hypothetical protein
VGASLDFGFVWAVLVRRTADDNSGRDAMKRNESYLVYPVTGLLLVVLLIAVIVGGPPTDELGTEGDGLVGQNTEPGVAQDLFDPPPGLDSENGLEVGTEDGESETGELTAAHVPLMATVPTAEVALERVLGTSTRDGDYRLVLASRGATLESIAEIWAGGAENLSKLETLNEQLVGDQLREGQQVLVPWVDASVLIVANEVRQDREVAAAAEEQIRSSAAARGERRVLGELYTVLKGESLWVIASKRGVSPNQIPGWINEFRRLNGDVGDVDALTPGQRVRLPGN